VLHTKDEGKAQHEELMAMTERTGAKFHRIKRVVQVNREKTIDDTQRYYEHKNGSCEITAKTGGQFELVSRM
jgi:hypothetical protein